ncbi:unnamed protein product [Spirodela intermedia]|uniref:Uncharacterized protein n=1 Tax=Spirodela intermedia TaxID=51605 RepID=A0A7I8JQQ7_SPIIN|nr:unnamed protein product [Spirodela intermedia]CAA6672125.1 unnamed protein product [Spirodela intermedia]
MQSLTQLQLSYDTNPGSIPACLGNLHKLIYLGFHGDKLSGTIPSPIFHNLTDLGTLEINSDKLEGTFMFSALANLSKLKEVDISGRSLEIDTETPVSWFPSFQLSFLSLRYCIINSRNAGRLPTFLWSQRKIKILFLRDAEITGTPPIGLFCNSSLGSLDLRNNSISGLFVVPCRNASYDAYEINLSHNHISGPLPENIHLSFPKLNILRIAGNKLEGRIPPSLGERQLVLLDLSDNHLSGEVPMLLP